MILDVIFRHDFTGDYPNVSWPREARGSTQTNQTFPGFVVALLEALSACGPQLCPISHTWLLQRKSCSTLWETAEWSQCKGLVGVSLWHSGTVSEKATTVCICWQLVSLLAMNLWNVSLEKNFLVLFSVNAFIHSGAEGAKFSSTLGSLGTFTKKLFLKVWFPSLWLNSVRIGHRWPGFILPVFRLLTEASRPRSPVTSVTLEVLPDSSRLQSGEEWLRGGSPGIYCY